MSPYLTQHIPLKRCQYTRRYGLYASRTKGKWPEMAPTWYALPLPGGRRAASRA